MPDWWRSLWTRRRSAGDGTPSEPVTYEARLAIYRGSDSLPQVMVLAADDCLSLIDSLCKRTVHAAQERGGVIPLLALREIVENLLHASFRDVVVSVLADGSVLVSDHGPGIPDKTRAMRPGFTTATASMRRYIRGVGSGLIVAQEAIVAIGGTLLIEDNLGGGTVVSLLAPPHHALVEEEVAAAEGESPAFLASPVPRAAADPAALGTVSPPPEGTATRKGEYTKGQPRQKPRARSTPAPARSGAGDPPLTPRQERLFRLFADLPEVGPSTAATEAGLSLASAYRELVALEHLGLLEPLPGGKRRLSPRGEDLLAALTKR